uniref:CSON007666 protein n=1 Tax=Culicoides sonorensis TaxID=179676 RepID=A0A336KFA0_CULSO
MSTKKGSGSRTRPQKHQNRWAFKNDLHDTTVKIKIINSIKIAEVCERCKEIIEWKRKYGKYKPLTQPKTCNKCGQKAIKQAYHVLCTPCAVQHKQCAKCLVSADEANILPPNKTKEEEDKEQVELNKLLKTLPERKRRTFLRYLKKKNEPKTENTENEDDLEGKSNQKKTTKVQESELDDVIRKKFDELKLINKKMDEELGFLHDLDESDLEGDSFGSCSDYSDEDDDDEA